MGLATISDLPPIEEFMPPIETANEIADELTYGVDDTTEVS
jgi:23S rRNA pseudouridine2605 synthase